MLSVSQFVILLNQIFADTSFSIQFWMLEVWCSVFIFSNLSKGSFINKFTLTGLNLSYVKFAIRFWFKALNGILIPSYMLRGRHLALRNVRFYPFASKITDGYCQRQFWKTSTASKRKIQKGGGRPVPFT